MHLIIALITAIGGLLWVLVRLRELGFSIDSINPFAWQRRRQWRKRVGTKPLHQINDPMEAAAVLLVAAAKTEGDISREQKREIIAIFTQEFKLSAGEAAHLFSASTFMLQGVLDAVAEVRNILAPTLERMTPEQKRSILALLDRVCRIDGDITETQSQLMETVARELRLTEQAAGTWG